MKKLTKSNEDYLEAILMLEIEKKNTKGKRGIKSVDIAKLLGVSKPAVNRAMNELYEAQLVDKSDYSDIKLTESGRAKAKQVYRKHLLLKQFLIHLGVDEKIAEEDSCKIEHVISPQTLKCIEKALESKDK